MTRARLLPQAQCSGGGGVTTAGKKGQGGGTGLEVAAHGGRAVGHEALDRVQVGVGVPLENDADADHGAGAAGSVEWADPGPVSEWARCGSAQRIGNGQSNWIACAQRGAQGMNAFNSEDLEDADSNTLTCRCEMRCSGNPGYHVGEVLLEMRPQQNDYVIL